MLLLTKLFCLSLASQAPQVVIQTGHKDPTQVVISSSRKLAVIAHSGGAKLWFVRTRRETQSLDRAEQQTA